MTSQEILQALLEAQSLPTEYDYGAHNYVRPTPRICHQLLAAIFAVEAHTGLMPVSVTASVNSSVVAYYAGIGKCYGLIEVEDDGYEEPEIILATSTNEDSIEVCEVPLEELFRGDLFKRTAAFLSTGKRDLSHT